MTTQCRICTVSDRWLPSLVLNAFRHGHLSVLCAGPVTLFTNSDSLKGFSYFGLTTAFLFFLSIDPSSAPLWYLKLFDSNNHIFSWFCKSFTFHMWHSSSRILYISILSGNSKNGILKDKDTENWSSDSCLSDL